VTAAADSRTSGETAAPPSRWPRLLTYAALFVVYVVAGKLGLRLASVNASATAVWAPTGIALVAMLLLGTGVWPVILLGAFVVNVTTAGTPFTSLGIAAGNTLEAIVGATLVNRLVGGVRAFDRVQGVVRFAVIAAMGSTIISATIGVTTLAVAGFAQWQNFGSIWLTWWLGDATGDLVVAPFLILWLTRPRVRWHGWYTMEAVALLAAIPLVNEMVNGNLFYIGASHYPLEYMLVPFLMWAAFRFGAREAATAVLLMSAGATWDTLRGYGPFVQSAQNSSLLLLEAFMFVTALMTLVLAAVVEERRRAEHQLRELAVTDPLTGLANYRRLVDVLDAEIRRTQRTERPFALLFLDLDGLKAINDRFGHLVGSRALSRVADALRASCRSIDTAARFGGDEFALIMPESGAEAALEAGRRIVEQLAADREAPPVTVSVGQAVYPGDGEDSEALIGAADRVLYEEKGRKGRARRKRPSS
jgi:diguanylate cyclase (GGDEF)-like protein